MIFTEGRFFLLFATCFCVYWALPSNRARKWWLLLCSCVFYGTWSLKFLAMIFVVVTIDYTTGLVLSRERVPGGRKLWLVVSLCANLGILGFFKYYNWFALSAGQFFDSIGLHASVATLNVVLPVGISFHTFQSMSYTIDVYRGRLKAERSFLDFSLFVVFFPQLVAGPIVQAIHFLPQLGSKRTWRSVQVRACLTLFLIGYFKKSCIADNVSPLVDQVFKDPAHWSALSNWLAVVLYSIQIYCDFSGYSDMALALAGLLGYELVLNFDFPYLATNITEFWRRWHISLSNWFRDYLYIPLGGNRSGSARTYANLFTVFFLCGLWHGASWNFVIWGLMHGTFLVVHRLWRQSVPSASVLGRIGAWSGPILTPLCVLTAWVLFRAVDLHSAGQMLAILFGARAGGELIGADLWWLFVLACGVLHWCSYRRALAPLERAAPDWVYAIGFGAAVALILPWVAIGYQPFIYFQF